MAKALGCEKVEGVSSSHRADLDKVELTDQTSGKGRAKGPSADPPFSVPEGESKGYATAGGVMRSKQA